MPTQEIERLVREHGSLMGALEWAMGRIGELEQDKLAKANEKTVKPGSYKEAAGCLKGLFDDEPVEQAIRRARDGVTKEMQENAALGELVRRLPQGSWLEHAPGGSDYWIVRMLNGYDQDPALLPEDAIADALRNEAEAAEATKKVKSAAAHECPKARC